MIEILLISVGLFVLGAALGSFGCCQVWRLRYRELGKKALGERSVCLSCGERLRWYELLPVVSWCAQRGRCRKCGKAIGWQEIMCEVGLGLVLVASYWLWPERLGGASETWWNWAGFGCFVAWCVGALILFVYDVRWQKLPTAILTFCVVCAILVVAFGDAAGFCRVDFYGGILLLAGTYWVLYRVSGEKWVGSGDWLVALMCAVLLGDWVAALLCMLVANVLGCIVAVPMMARAGGKKKAAKMRLAMGPLLLAGFLVVFWFGEPLRALLGI